MAGSERTWSEICAFDGEFKVGTVVRAPRPSTEPAKQRVMGRAMIATIHDESICLLWEPMAPQSVNISKKFLVAPSLAFTQSTTAEASEETTLPHSEIQALLAFESGDEEISEASSEVNYAVWKDRGDQLLRLGDAATAIGYYEEALRKTSQLSIGSSVLVSRAGFPVVAEVDCVEEDIVDVMFVESGEDATITPKDLLIAIMEPDPDKIQERTLLNLARCLLLHCKVDTKYRAKYLKAAVLACTLVISISEFHHHANSDDGNGNCNCNGSGSGSGRDSCAETIQTALVLRIKAYGGLSKWPNATADSKRLVKIGNNQGQKLLDSIELQKKQQQKQDKKLVKAISRMVESATASSVSNEREEAKKDGGEFRIVGTDSKVDASTLAPTSNANHQNAQPAYSLFSPVNAMFVLVAAFFMKNMIF